MPKKPSKQAAQEQEEQIEQVEHEEIDQDEQIEQADQDEQQNEQNEQDGQDVHIEQTDQAEQNDDNTVKSMQCSEFEIERMWFKAQEPDPDATQLMCYPKYIYPSDEEIELTPENFEKYGESMIFVTMPIYMDKGGIPRYDQRYHGADKDSMKRAYFYIPKNKTSSVLFGTCQKIDDYMHDQINEKQNKNGVLCILKDNKTKKRLTLKGLTYKRMITTAKPGTDMNNLVDDDDDDKEKGNKKGNKKGSDKGGNNREFVPWDRIKAKFSTVFDESLEPDDKKELNTQVYMPGKDEPENCKTVSDIAEFFTWKCTAQFALMFNKVWIKKADDKSCGFGIKCIQIGITEPAEKRASTNRQLNKRLFPSSAAPANKTIQEKPADKPAGKTMASTTKKTTVTKKQLDDENQDENQEEGQNDNQDDNQDENQDENQNDNQDENQDASEPEEEEPKTKKVTKNTKSDVKVKGKSTDNTGKGQTEKKPAPKKGKKN